MICTIWYNERTGNRRRHFGTQTPPMKHGCRTACCGKHCAFLFSLFTTTFGRKIQTELRHYNNHQGVPVQIDYCLQGRGSIPYPFCPSRKTKLKFQIDSLNWLYSEINGTPNLLEGTWNMMMSHRNTNDGIWVLSVQPAWTNPLVQLHCGTFSFGIYTYTPSVCTLVVAKVTVVYQDVDPETWPKTPGLGSIPFPSIQKVPIPHVPRWKASKRIGISVSYLNRLGLKWNWAQPW